MDTICVSLATTMGQSTGCSWVCGLQLWGTWALGTLWDNWPLNLQAALSSPQISALPTLRVLPCAYSSQHPLTQPVLKTQVACAKPLQTWPRTPTPTCGKIQTAPAAQHQTTRMAAALQVDYSPHLGLTICGHISYNNAHHAQEDSLSTMQNCICDLDNAVLVAHGLLPRPCDTNPSNPRTPNQHG